MFASVVSLAGDFARLVRGGIVWRRVSVPWLPPCVRRRLLVER